MTANREKTSSVMGFVVSILLHGIFLAGCLALDLTHTNATSQTDSTEINQVSDQVNTQKPKS